VQAQPASNGWKLIVADDISRLNLIDHFLVLIGQRAAAAVSSLNGCVQASLFNMPCGNLQMLVNIHGLLLFNF